GLALREVALAYSFQQARYDGELQGTEVGMILFYSDLLAKLWVLDHAHTAPVRHLKGFPTLLAVHPAAIYQQERRTSSYSRLWFGPDRTAFQMAQDSDSLFFTFNATRIYAASSNPLEPGVEVNADPVVSTVIGWWDRHYAEIAEHEQEYQRLSEVV